MNPTLKERGRAMIYNPLDKKISRMVSLPIYYSGLSDAALIRVGETEPKKVALARDHSAEVDVIISPKGRIVIRLETPRTML